MDRKFTIGLLECDHVRPEFLDAHGDYRTMFPAFFQRFSNDVSIINFDVVNGFFPESADACDAFITSGSSYSVYEDIPWIGKLAEFIRELDRKKKPFAGICFGHQLLAYALGGQVEKSPVGWCVGVHEFSILERTGWMQPFVESVRLLMMCQDQVLELPQDFVRVASSSDCPNAMIRKGSHMIGIQAHPEFTAAYIEALINLRRDKIGSKKSEIGIASLDRKTSGELIADWIIQFFCNLQER